ncbi:MAG: DUF4396 domain-containing protein [Thermodesulfobacteriota bacterium]
MRLITRSPAAGPSCSSLERGNDPKGLMFWGSSSLATIAGAGAAYPINSWLVGSGLKHGMISAVSGITTGEGMPGMSGDIAA